ncbi:MAG TPA: hypothetical protein PK733_13310 [Clostridiales bacterium]|nr:hypothetical protein [Clostridiales bacterium]
MKKLINILCVCFISFIVCSSSEQDTKLEGYLEGLMPVLSYEDMLQESELIAEVKILKKLSIAEIKKDPAYYNGWDGNSFFEALIVEDYKNTQMNGQKIVLKQLGNEKWRYENHPIFSVDEQFLLFLNKASVNNTISSIYYIVGFMDGTFDIEEYESKKYAKNRGREFNSLDEIKVKNITGLKDTIKYSNKKYQSIFLLNDLKYKIKDTLKDGDKK